MEWGALENLEGVVPFWGGRVGFGLEKQFVWCWKKEIWLRPITLALSSTWKCIYKARKAVMQKA
jgi:hypothetical protein